MSRIGKKPVIIESGVTVSQNGPIIDVKGPKGALQVKLHPRVGVTIKDNQLLVDVKDSALLGLYRSLIQNAVSGVSKGWNKQLELVGVGYRAQTTGSELVLSLGFSHPVKVPAPAGITFSVSENIITVSGSDKYLVGEVAATIRRKKPPEPYKGKGIRYKGEYVRKKLGKAAKAVGGAPGAAAK